MPRKVIQIQVDVHIQAVTCPGAWLCPQGKVSLHLYMLDSCIQTEPLEPVFPLNYDEKVVFYKCFAKIQTLTDLHRSLEKRYVYAELVQLDDRGDGNVLATFQNSIDEVLFPGVQGAIVGMDVDLLMEPAPHFPGIIAPKIELSSRTTLEEIMFCDRKDAEAHHKVITSNPNSTCLKSRLHQRRVCHSYRYHTNITQIKMKHARRPVFAYRKADETLIGRKPGFGLKESSPKCRGCRKGRSSPLRSKLEGVQNILTKISAGSARAIKYAQPNPTVCICGDAGGNCTVCTKYKYYFKPNDNSANRQSCDQKNESCPCKNTERSACERKSTSAANEVGADILHECPECKCGGNCHKVCYCNNNNNKSSLAQMLHDKVNKTVSAATSCCSTGERMKFW